MRRGRNADADVQRPLRIRRVPCATCGQAFGLRTEAADGPARVPTAWVERLCPACFDAWCLVHPPMRGPEGGDPDGTQVDESD